MSEQQEQRYPPIFDYALISDCHSTALVSRSGSIDWCCLPRIDDDSCFGRLLDWDKGGYCLTAPVDSSYTSSRSYLPDTMILCTRFVTSTGTATLHDFFTVNADGGGERNNALVRIIDGISGEVVLRQEICPRFDYGEIDPYVRRDASGVYTATGSNKGLLINADVPLEVVGRNKLRACFPVRAGQRVRLLIRFTRPELIDRMKSRALPEARDIDRHFEQTREWWQDWASRMRCQSDIDDQTVRSAIILKSLTFDETGAIVAAPTTSLPEWVGGSRNWDYRFSWIRDSVFIIRALRALGYMDEADRFDKFIQRSAAGSAGQLQVMFAVDGKRRLTEVELDWLEGYRGSRPVRLGNAAARQTQLDIYGELLEMAWGWHLKGHGTDADYWDFLRDVINMVCARWQECDRGIWEMRGKQERFVHSQVMCWAAIDRGISLAKANGFDAPHERWMQTRDAIRHAVETRGYDDKRGIFVQAFDGHYLDSALLLMPRVGFIGYRDPRMMRTAEAICRELDDRGLVRRYNSPDGLPGPEGIFLPCTFWLSACLAHQGRREEAWRYYRRALGCANDLGLFSEEHNVATDTMLGNFPQGLTHVSQITARLALAEAARNARDTGDRHSANSSA